VPLIIEFGKTAQGVIFMGHPVCISKKACMSIGGITRKAWLHYNAKGSVLFRH